MIKFNDTFIIGIDHGYGNLKTANTVTPSGVKIHESEPPFKRTCWNMTESTSASERTTSFSWTIRQSIWIITTLLFTVSHRNYPLRASRTVTFILQWGFHLCGIRNSVRALQSISGRMNMWSLRITAKSIISTLTASQFILRDTVRFMTSSEIWTE